MNLLRNPAVVGLLAVAAVGFVAYQTIHPHWPQRSAADSPPPAPVAPVAEPSRPASAADPQPAAAPELAMDSNYVARRWSDWINTPRRDPFFLAQKAVASSAPLPPWKLKGIWLQSSVAMAAINQGVYRVGDVLEGYIILNINDNEVWLEKDARKVVLGFGNPAPAKIPGPK